VSQTKYVKYAGRGFWAYDVILGVFLKYLIDAAEASDQATTEWLSGAVSSWREVACIPDYGLSLDENWSQAERQCLVLLAEMACLQLAKRPSIPTTEFDSWSLLEDFHIYPRGATEVFTGPIVELGRAIMALISGTLPEAPSGTAWFYTSTGRQTIGMGSR
jgi:hypothetical protein